MSAIRLGLLCIAFAAGLNAASAEERCTAQYYPSCQCEPCQDDACCDDDRCCAKKCWKKPLGCQLCIPSIRIGFSFGCCDDDRCGRGCFSCCKDKPKRGEPPRAPLVFSVPAVTVAQQALAVNHAVPVQSAAKCQSQNNLERELVNALVERLAASQASSQSEAKATSQSEGKASSQAAGTKTTEERLAELEARLDRILEKLEQQ